MGKWIAATGAAVGAGFVAGAGSLGYALWEARQYCLRSYSVPVLPAGCPPVRILHLSDLHLTARDTDRAEWIAGLAELAPDLVVVTGDFLSADSGIPLVAAALEQLLPLPGAFVFGSNDVFGARPIDPTKYFRGPSKLPKSGHRVHLHTAALREVLTAQGWHDLNNASAELTVGDGVRLALRGVGDPHVKWDRYRLVAGDWPECDVQLGVVHAPYLRVLDAMSDDGTDLILAGHTHGGQVCLPGVGTLVTNCDLDRARARGLSRYGDSWLHVSAGLGTNPNAPIRVACRPEAVLLTLVPRN